MYINIEDKGIKKHQVWTELLVHDELQKYLAGSESE